MDAEAEIKGFSEENVPVYISKFFGSKGEAEDLLEEALNNDLIQSTDYRILKIPLLLNMICVLYSTNEELPSTKTEVYEAIVERCMNREALRQKGQKAMDSADQALVRLGKLAWEGLQSGRILIFNRVRKILLLCLQCCVNAPNGNNVFHF